MKYRWMNGLCTALLAAIILLPAMVTDAHAKGDGGKKGERSAEKSAEFREKILRKMQEKLELDTATAAEIGEIQSAQREKSKAIREELKAVYAELEKALANEEATDAEIQALMDRAEAKKKEMIAVHGETQKMIAAKIGPKKAAQLLLMKQKMMNKMKEMAKGGGKKGQGKKGSWRSEKDDE